MATEFLFELLERDIGKMNAAHDDSRPRPFLACECPLRSFALPTKRVEFRMSSCSSPTPGRNKADLRGTDEVDRLHVAQLKVPAEWGPGQ